MLRIILISLVMLAKNAIAANVVNYPDRAEKLRIEGEVNVLYDIDDHGHPQNIRIIKASPRYVFERSVYRQISKWNYPSDNPKENLSLRIIFKAN